MADIALRFQKDCLVLTGSVMPQLERDGIDSARDAEFTLMFEPETYEAAYRLQAATGAQCMVAPTAGLTPARLAQAGLSDSAEALAQSALALVQSFNPQHILVEIAPCELPLDPSSKTSLRENMDQYARAARLFTHYEPEAVLSENAQVATPVQPAGTLTFDAYFLNGFTSVTDLKCALMGVRKVSDVPVFASVCVEALGVLPSGETLFEAFRVMEEYGAQVAGVETEMDAKALATLLTSARTSGETHRPLAVQLGVGHAYPNPDTMADAAFTLQAAGVQFFRAAGAEATPAFTGALVAATAGMDVHV